MSAYVGLGSNVGDGPAEIEAALGRLRAHAEVRVKRVSSLYRSAAWGKTDQPDFTNAVVELETTLGAEALLAVLQAAERAGGRQRSVERWGPRRIDLDLLSHGARVVSAPGLQLPHPRMAERAFVLVPLLELEPEFEIPGIGSAANCLARLPPQRVERLG